MTNMAHATPGNFLRTPGASTRNALEVNAQAPKSPANPGKIPVTTENSKHTELYV
jgi:hypothetical protein